MSDAETRRQTLVEVYNQASVCERCPLSETRNRVVFGAGNADADLMFVGEALAQRRTAKACPSSAVPAHSSPSSSRGSG